MENARHRQTSCLFYGGAAPGSRCVHPAELVTLRQRGSRSLAPSHRLGAGGAFFNPVSAFWRYSFT
jgi:hypothetical protein